LGEQDEKLFLAPKLSKWETEFGKMCNNLSLKFGVFSSLVKLKSEFLVSQKLSDWQNMFGEIDPRC